MLHCKIWDFLVLQEAQLLQVLLSQGLVQQDPVGKTYRPGLGMYSLATTILHRTSFIQIARAIMRELVENSGESTCLNLLDRDRGVFSVAAVEESAAQLQYVIETDQFHPLHAGASGRAILAFQPDAFIDSVLTTALAAVTDQTLTDPALLRTQLVKIRATGYCVSAGERIAGAVGIAAPLRDSHGYATGSVQLTIPTHRFRQRDVARLSVSVMDAAQRISDAALALGHAH